MLRSIFQPHVNAAALILRLGIATIVVYHGILKSVQQGGADWNDTLTVQTQMAVAWGEIVAGAALAFGLLSRLAALGLIVIQVGAILLVTGQEFIYIQSSPSGFNFQRPGYEYNFALIIMCLAVVFLGSGVVSLDRLIWRRRSSEPTEQVRSL